MHLKLVWRQEMKAKRIFISNINGRWHAVVMFSDNSTANSVSFDTEDGATGWALFRYPTIPVTLRRKAKYPPPKKWHVP